MFPSLSQSPSTWSGRRTGLAAWGVFLAFLKVGLVLRFFSFCRSPFEIIAMGILVSMVVSQDQEVDLLLEKLRIALNQRFAQIVVLLPAGEHLGHEIAEDTRQALDNIGLGNITFGIQGAAALIIRCIALYQIATVIVGSTPQ